MGGHPLCTIYLPQDHQAGKQGRREPIPVKRQGREMAIVGGEGRCVLFRASPSGALRTDAGPRQKLLPH